MCCSVKPANFTCTAPDLQLMGSLTIYMGKPMASGIDIYSQLLMSAIRIVDISNSIADINNSN